MSLPPEVVEELIAQAQPDVPRVPAFPEDDLRTIPGGGGRRGGRRGRARTFEERARTRHRLFGDPLPPGVTPTRGPDEPPFTPRTPPRPAPPPPPPPPGVVPIRPDVPIDPDVPRPPVGGRPSATLPSRIPVGPQAALGAGQGILIQLQFQQLGTLIASLTRSGIEARDAAVRREQQIFERQLAERIRIREVREVAAQRAAEATARAIRAPAPLVISDIPIPQALPSPTAVPEIVVPAQPTAPPAPEIQEIPLTSLPQRIEISPPTAPEALPSPGTGGAPATVPVRAPVTLPRPSFLPALLPQILPRILPGTRPAPIPRIQPAPVPRAIPAPVPEIVLPTPFTPPVPITPIAPTPITPTQIGVLDLPQIGPVPQVDPAEECQRVQRKKRRKGKCREGFFAEFPGETKFVTWRDVDCRTRKPIKRKRARVIPFPSI